MSRCVKKSSTAAGRRPLARCWLLGALMVAWCAGGTADPAKAPSSSNAPASAAKEPEVPKSIFVLPTAPKEARDPFYPNRPVTVIPLAPTPGSVKPAQAVSLVLNGISGTPAHRLCIINGQTLGKGDEDDVKTPEGRKVKVRCLSIEDDGVVIEVEGQRRDLRLRGQ